MLSTALRTNKPDGASQLPGSGRSAGRTRGGAAEKVSRQLRAVAPDREAAEPAEGGLGDVAGPPRGRMPDSEDDTASSGSAAPEGAAPVAEPTLSDYSTIGAYLHELRRYPL